MATARKRAPLLTEWKTSFDCTRRVQSKEVFHSVSNGALFLAVAILEYRAVEIHRTRLIGVVVNVACFNSLFGIDYAAHIQLPSRITCVPPQSPMFNVANAWN